jgi:hypothetical protein
VVHFPVIGIMGVFFLAGVFFWRRFIISSTGASRDQPLCRGEIKKAFPQRRGNAQSLDDIISLIFNRGFQLIHGHFRLIVLDVDRPLFQMDVDPADAIELL